MQVWVDADACPNAIKDIIFNAAKRTKTTVIFVANQWISIPASSYFKLLVVAKGFDAADNEIINRLIAGDIVITADIPLAAESIAKQAKVITPKGECFDEVVIKERLIIRDFNDTLRASGIQTSRTNPFSAKDRHNFANNFNQLLLSALACNLKKT